MSGLRFKLTKKSLFYLCVYVVFCWIFFHAEVALLTPMFSESQLFFNKYLLRIPGCSLPLYDSYHWTLGLSLSEDVPYERSCSGQEPDILAQHFGRIVMNASALRRLYNVSELDTKCYYREVFRNESAPGPDNAPVLGPHVPLKLGDRLNAEYVQVMCEAHDKPLFKEYFLLPLSKPLATVNSDANEEKPARNEKPISVLILGIDSTSRMNFHRHMVKTGRYLEAELNAFEFIALNKVDDNSFPNLIPLLTGMSGSEAESVYRRYGKFDQLPLIWKEYKLRGYTTLYMEEWPFAGIFVYPTFVGLMKVPTDYYPTSILRMMDDGDLQKMECMGARLKTKVLVNYLADILKLNHERPMFSFVWLSYVTHNNVNGLQLLDDTLERFLRESATYGVLKNTALLFMSDHGMRMGRMSATEIGRYENKNPFCFLALPKRFLADNPMVAAHLEVNQRRLITNYDLHATLISLSEWPKFGTNSTDKGLSLFGPIPPERTCADAFIPRHFCACLDDSRSVNDPKVSLNFAWHAVDYINALAKVHFGESCVVWKLGTVDRAWMLAGFADDAVQLRVQITTVPNAVFEVYGTLGNLSSSVKSVDLVLRLDKYANQTTCLPRSKWQKVCMCKSYLLTSTTRETFPFGLGLW
ncbi:hypothetical protein HPB51_016460 [Rhipicephalus microplus]|uniref:DUF229 domain containing protein n=1 Tax=Rhipicephalus microplus TaxID=6941 RepID=A0A9J6DV50_RHIMP|nr:uncharacterized protein LOC119169288 [Rhipicephalus microplus]KAH8026149.1 hypothetical protein HPB51_016460 [Rhipicephalus microplus]